MAFIIRKGGASLEKLAATIVGVIGSIVSYMVDGLGMAVTILIGMMAIDYLTGLMSGIVNKNLNSRIGFVGLIRKLYYLLLVAAVYAIALIVPGIEFAGDGAAIAFILLEFISITENGGKMGLPIPKYIQDLLLALKNKSDGDDE